MATKTTKKPTKKPVVKKAVEANNASNTTVKDCSFIGVNYDKTSMETVEKVVDAFHKGMEASHQAGYAISRGMEGLNKIADLFIHQNIQIETLLHLGPMAKDKPEEVKLPF